MTEKAAIGSPEQKLSVTNKTRLHWLAGAYRYHLQEWESYLEEFRSDLRYAMGEQWDEAQEAKLKKDRRSTEVYDLIGSQVDSIVGFEVDTRKQVVAEPLESDDIYQAEMVTAVLREQERKDENHALRSEVAEDSANMGLGIKSFLYDEEIKDYRMAHESIFSHIPDRESTDKLWRDSRIHFRRRLMSLFDLRDTWPDRKSDLQAIKPSPFSLFTGKLPEFDFQDIAHKTPRSDYTQGGVNQMPSIKDTDRGQNVNPYYDERKKKFWVIEAWELTKRKITIVEERIVRGNLETWEEIAEVPWYIDENGQVVKNDQGIAKAVRGFEHYRTREVEKPVWRKTVWVGDVILGDGYTSYPILPFVPYFWKFKYDGERKLIRGVVRPMKGPQKSLNKGYSQLFTAVNKAIGSIILMNEDLYKSVDKETWTEALRTGNVIIPVNAETLKEGESWVKIKPTEVPNSAWALPDAMRNMLYEVGGWDPNILQGWQQKGDPSGVALEERKESAFTKISSPFDNIKQAEIRFMRDLVWPLLKGNPKKIRIRKKYLREFWQASAAAGKPPMAPFGDMVANVPFQELGGEQLRTLVDSGFMSAEEVRKGYVSNQIFNPLYKIDADIVFDEKTLTTTERQRNLALLIKLREMGVAGVDDLLLLDHVDSSLAETIKQRALLAMKMKQDPQGPENQPPGGGPPQGQP